VRFALAIVAFIAAAVMIGFGIAQRTVFLEPDRVSLSAEIEGDAAYTVIEPEALGAHPGKQTITVSGTDAVFVSYGRSSDVSAWIGDAPYVAVGYDGRCVHVESPALQGVHDQRAGRVVVHPGSGAVRRHHDGRRERLGHRRYVPLLPPVFSSTRTSVITADLSTALTMSTTVRAATETAVSASISTPVRSVVRTEAVMEHAEALEALGLSE